MHLMVNESFGIDLVKPKYVLGLLVDLLYFIYHTVCLQEDFSWPIILSR